jgi:hypothetical protein
MMHPEYTKTLVADHVAQLLRDARPGPVPRRIGAAVDTGDVELRLCRVGDDPELERLAGLDGKPLPDGRLVVAVLQGRIVAALPLLPGQAIRDPFVRTDHLLPLLELRAAQLRDREPRRSLIPRYVNLIRGSIHA